MELLNRLWVREGDVVAFRDWPLNKPIETVSGNTIVVSEIRKTEETQTVSSQTTYRTWEIWGSVLKVKG